MLPMNLFCWDLRLRTAFCRRPVETFLAESDMGARTIYPFVAGEGNDEETIFSAISQLQPGALMGAGVLLLDGEGDRAAGMIYSFYGRLSVGTTDVELLRSGQLPPTFYCYGTRDPFYDQFLANADAAEEAGVEVERLQLDDMPHGLAHGAAGFPPMMSGFRQFLREIRKPEKS